MTPPPSRTEMRFTVHDGSPPAACASGGSDQGSGRDSWLVRRSRPRSDRRRQRSVRADTVGVARTLLMLTSRSDQNARSSSSRRPCCANVECAHSVGHRHSDHRDLNPPDWPRELHTPSVMSDRSATRSLTAATGERAACLWRLRQLSHATPRVKLLHQGYL